MADDSAPGPTEDQLGIALINAHNAGDDDAARKLAGAIISMRSSQSAATPIPGSSPASPLDDIAHAASAGTIARASLAPDQDVQIKRYAESFGQPISDFGVVGDHIVRRLPENGQYARVEPSVAGGTDILDTARRLGDWVAGGAGQAIPAIGSGVGAIGAGLAAAPTGLGAVAAAMAGGAAGGAGGEIARQKLDQALAPANDATKTDWGNVGWQGVGGAAVPIAGAVVGKAVGAAGNAIGRFGESVYDLPAGTISDAVNPVTNTPSLGLSPDTIQSMQERISGKYDELQRLIGAAKEFGFTPTLGQLTNSEAAQAAERQSAQQIPMMQKFADMADAQNKDQLPSAVDKVLDDIAPAAPASEQVSNFRSGADAVVKKSWDDLRAQAQPVYASALDDRDPFINDKLKSMLTTPTMKAAWGEAQKNAADEGRVLPKLFDSDADGNFTLNSSVMPDWRSWQDIKIGLNDVINAGHDPATGSYTPDAGRAIRMKGRLMSELYNANPDWAAADAKYGSDRDVVDAVLNGGAGVINKMNGADRQNMVSSIFTAGQKIMPDTIPTLRQQFFDAGHGDDWNGALRNYVANTFSTASKAAQTGGDPVNAGGKMYAALWGNPDQAAVMDAALGGADTPLAQRWNRLGDVMQMASRRLPPGSNTAMDTGAPTLVKGGAVGAAKALLAGPRAVGDNIIAGLNNMEKQANAQKFADYTLNSEEGMKALRDLSATTPGTDKANSILENLLTQAGVVGAIDTTGNSQRPR